MDSVDYDLPLGEHVRTTATTDPHHGRSARLAVSRPRGVTFGMLRRLRLELDGVYLGGLQYGTTLEVPAPPGAHLLRARFRPLSSACLSIELSCGRPLLVEVWFDSDHELQLRLSPAARQLTGPIV